MPAERKSQAKHPLHIIPNYGHDGNDELVRCIKPDLEKCGHDVGFDKNGFKFGDEPIKSGSYGA